MRRLTPLLINLSACTLARLLVPVVLEDGGERYTYYGMSLFFPFARCPSFHCFRFVPPLLASLLPLQPLDAFSVTGFVCQVLTGTLLWHIAERMHPSRRVALLTVCGFWVVWGPLPMLREPLLIADPVQALWLVTALLLLLDRRFLIALPVLVTGAGVKESVLTVPFIYTAFLILSGENIRRKIPWLLTLMAVPLASWVVVRRVLLAAFAYTPPDDSSYVAHPYLFGLWLNSLGTWPHNLGVAALYIFSGFGAAWIFGAFGFRRGDRRLRSLAAASVPAMAFLALYQEPHRAVACFAWAVLIPAAAYMESLPMPLVAAVLLANAAFTLRMSAGVEWLPRMPVLLVLLVTLVACCVWLRERRAPPAASVRAPTPPAAGGRLISAAVGATAVLLILVIGRDVLIAATFQSSALALPPAVAITDDDSGTPGLAVSPDGNRIAFVGAASSGVRQLWMRPTDSEAVEPLEGTERASAPFWSPDSRSLGFFADGKLKTFDIAAHRVTVIADAPDAHGGTWGRRDVIIFTASGGLRRVDAAGGVAAVAVVAGMEPLPDGTSYRWPAFLPDGEHFLFAERNVNGDERWLWLGSIRSRESRRVLDDASAPAYVEPGLVFFLRQGGLLAQAFDMRRLAFQPFAVTVLKQVAHSVGFSRIAVGVSARTLVYATGTSETVDRGRRHTSTLRWYDRAGRATGDVRRQDAPFGVSLSPDERTAALGALDANGILLLDLAHPAKLPDQLLERRGAPVWSPDGTRLAFAAADASRTDWQIQLAPTGGGTATTLLRAPRMASPLSWSPDGRVLIYLSRDPAAGDLWAVTLTGNAPPVPVARGSFQAAHAQFSPDGRWIAYAAQNGPSRDVFVQPYPPTGQKWIVSADGGDQPRWRADSRELIYVSSNRFVMAVDVQTEPAFRLGIPHRLFEARLRSHNDDRSPSDDLFQYAISRDAQRFLVDTIDDAESSAIVRLATNWKNSLRLLERP